jgi:hypothetical protein
MARPPSPKAGVGPCPECGVSIIFRRSAGGMLTHSCGYCDSSGFAAHGGDAYKKRVQNFTVNYLEETPIDPAPGGNPEETTKTKPEDSKPPKRVAASVFDLGAL